MMKIPFKLAAFGGLLLGVALTGCTGSPDTGKKYLEEQGFTKVEGGNVNLFNSCGKGIYGREYNAVSPKGGRGDQTVCFGPLGPYRSLLSFK